MSRMRTICGPRGGRFTCFGKSGSSTAFPILSLIASMARLPMSTVHRTNPPGNTTEKPSTSTPPARLTTSLKYLISISPSNTSAINTAFQLYWQQADLKTATIHPDAYFAITDPQQPEDRNMNHFFLEIERSKFSNYQDGEPSIIRKLGKYYDLFDTRACEKDWGFKQFRVIVVQRTDERRRNLCYALQEKYKHRMFWLTTEALYKQDIGVDAFLTPKDHQERAYGFSTFRENLVRLNQSLEKAGTLILSPASEQPLGSS